MNNYNKEFVQHRFPELLKTISSNTPPLWGKMNLQQMVEHFSDYVKIASGRTVVETIVTPQEHLAQARQFMMSDKAFRPNTPNPLMEAIPRSVRNASIEDAIAELEKEIDFFISAFEQNNTLTTRNPFFGSLNYEENLQLLHKHAVHHLAQFGVVI